MLKLKEITEMKNNLIEITNNKKLYNEIKKSSKKVTVYEFKELVNIYGKHYAWKKTGRFISTKNLEKFENNQTKDEIQQDLINEIHNKFNELFPNAPISADELIENYTKKNNRKISKEIINRLYALTVAYIRHNYTDYEGSYNNAETHSIAKQQYNQQAHSIVREWQCKVKRLGL